MTVYGNHDPYGTHGRIHAGRVSASPRPLAQMELSVSSPQPATNWLHTDGNARTVANTAISAQTPVL